MLRASDTHASALLTLGGENFMIARATAEEEFAIVHWHFSREERRTKRHPTCEAAETCTDGRADAPGAAHKAIDIYPAGYAKALWTQ